MANILIIPNKQIKRSTFIDENVDDDMLRIACLDAQEQIVQPILGDKLYEVILDGMANNTISDTYASLATDYIWPVMYQAVPYKLAYNLLFRFTASSIVKDDNENSKSISKTDLNVLISERELGMNYHIDRLKKHLMAYSTTYPDYLGAPPIDGDAPDLTENQSNIWDYGDS